MMRRLCEGEQKTFAVFALCITEMTMSVLEPALRGGNQGKQCDKIMRWINECHAVTEYKHIAVPGRRIIEHLTVTSAKFTRTEHLNDEERMFAWVKNLWMATTFVSDVTAICPDVYRPQKRRWEFLYQTLVTLCVRFLQLYPTADEDGVAQNFDMMTAFEDVIEGRVTKTGFENARKPAKMPQTRRDGAMPSSRTRKSNTPAAVSPVWGAPVAAPMPPHQTPTPWDALFADK